MEQKIFVMNENFANAVLQYLAERPFREVAHFVEGFQKLLTVEEFNSIEKKTKDGGDKTSPVSIVGK